MPRVDNLHAAMNIPVRLVPLTGHFSVKLWSLYFTNKESFEAAGAVIPFEPFAVPVPKLQAMLLLVVLISRRQVRLLDRIRENLWENKSS